MSSLISADNTWALWAIMVTIAAGSIILEQKYAWANKLTGAIIALVCMMALANFNVIPTNAPAYDTVWGYVVPLAVPLLLFQCNLKRIGKETGRLLIVYLVSSVGTILGAILGGFLYGSMVPEVKAAVAMFTGTYTGGSVNFAAMAEQFGQTGTPFAAAAVVADNLLMVLYFFVLIAMPSLKFFRKAYKHPVVDEIEAGNKGDTNAAAEHWKAKPIALKDIGFDIAVAFVIVWLSTELANFLGSIIPSEGAMYILNALFGNKYLIMTTATMLLATFLPNVFGKAAGANELGTFLIYIFFTVIGAPASIMEIVRNSPILFVFAFTVVFVNLIVTFGVGKIAKFNLEDMIIASNANVGGPTTAAAMAISKGWAMLVGPAMLVGVLGYVIGNYFGIIASSLF